MFGVLRFIRSYFGRRKEREAMAREFEVFKLEPPAGIIWTRPLSKKETESLRDQIHAALEAMPKKKPRKGYRWCRNLDGTWSQVKVPKPDPAKRHAKRRVAA